MGEELHPRMYINMHKYINKTFLFLREHCKLLNSLSVAKSKHASCTFLEH